MTYYFSPKPLKKHPKQENNLNHNKQSCQVKNMFTLLLLILSTVCHHCESLFAPADAGALKTAVDACFDETSDGTCPTAVSNTFSNTVVSNILFTRLYTQRSKRQSQLVKALSSNIFSFNPCSCSVLVLVLFHLSSSW